MFVTLSRSNNSQHDRDNIYFREGVGDVEYVDYEQPWTMDEPVDRDGSINNDDQNEDYSAGSVAGVNM